MSTATSAGRNSARAAGETAGASAVPEVSREDTPLRDRSKVGEGKVERESGLAAMVWLWKGQILADGSRAWHLPSKMVAFICLAPIIVALMGAATALLGKEAYIWFTGEDGFAESLQVLCYALAFGLSLIVARRRQRAGEPVIALLYLGLSLALFFLIGEELSWGQRIFNWETASSFAAVNKQDETNLHNVYGVGATFKWIQMLVGAYGAILPLVILRWPPPARFRELITAVVPHYTLILYFLPLFLWRIYRNLMDPPEEFYFVVAEYNEVMELILALGFFLFVVFQLRHLTRTAGAPRGKRGGRSGPPAPS